MNQTVKVKRSSIMLHRGLVGMQGLLVIQFAVGMYLNLYTKLPDIHPGTGDSYAPSIPWAISGSAGLALSIHVIVWVLLTVGGVALLARAIISHRKTIIVGTSLGLAFILMAGSSGLTFLNRCGANEESFMMALGFILALIAYGMTFYRTQTNGSESK